MGWGEGEETWTISESCKNLANIGKGRHSMQMACKLPGENQSEKNERGQKEKLGTFLKGLVSQNGFFFSYFISWQDQQMF